MKKNLFSLVGAGLTMVAVLTFVYVKNEVNKNNEIFNANVEALAQEELKESDAVWYVIYDEETRICGPGGEDKCQEPDKEDNNSN